MFYLIIKYILISLIIIVLLHNIYIYLKNALTVSKVRDLVIKPSIRYKDIISKIEKNNMNSSIENKKMKDELKLFLDELQDTNNNTNSIINKDDNNNDLRSSNEIISSTMTDAFSKF